MNDWDNALKQNDIQYNLSFGDYRKAPGLNFSSLKKLKQSPAACWREMEREEDSPASAAMRFGTMAHCCVLEPQRFQSVYVRVPNGLKMDKRTKAYKEWTESVEGEPVKAKDYDRALEIRDTFHDQFPWLFKGKQEVSIFWDEIVDGVRVPCKARLDTVTAKGIWDLKTCQSANPATFERAAVNYDYPAQLAFYLRGAIAVGLVSEDAGTWIAAAESQGDECALFNMQDAIDYGHSIVDDWLAEYAKCFESGSWPSLVEQGEFMFQLPHWASADDEGGFEL